MKRLNLAYLKNYAKEINQIKQIHQEKSQTLRELVVAYNLGCQYPLFAVSNNHDLAKVMACLRLFDAVLGSKKHLFKLDIDKVLANHDNADLIFAKVLMLCEKHKNSIVLYIDDIGKLFNHLGLMQLFKVALARNKINMIGSIKKSANNQNALNNDRALQRKMNIIDVSDNQEVAIA